MIVQLKKQTMSESKHCLRSTVKIKHTPKTQRLQLNVAQTSETLSKSCLLVHTAALTDHVGAGACKRHELGVELEAGYWSCVLPI